MRAGLAFVSCGVNRVVNAVDWGDGGLVAYAGHRMVCIYDPQVRARACVCVCVRVPVWVCVGGGRCRAAASAQQRL
jgi:elongator complex protein 2